MAVLSARLLTQRIRGVRVQVVEFFETLMKASARSLPDAAMAPAPDRPGPFNTVPYAAALPHSSAPSASDALFETLESALAAWRQGACARRGLSVSLQRAVSSWANRPARRTRDCLRIPRLSIPTRLYMLNSSYHGSTEAPLYLVFVTSW